MTLYEETMQAILARLQGSPALCDNVRRSHKVAVTQSECPAVYLAEGNDKPIGKPNGCRQEREAYPSVRVFDMAPTTKDDAGPFASVDTLVAEVVERLNPEIGPPYPNGVTVELDDITVDEEDREVDWIRKDINLCIRYTAGVFSLSTPT